MYVNGFWLGVLATLVVEIFIFIIAGIVNILKQERYEEYEPSEEEFQKVLNDITGMKFEIKKVDGHLVGVPVNDKADREEETDESETE